MCPAHRQRGQGDYPSRNRESPLDITISLASPHGSKDDTPQNKKADYKRPDAIGKEAFYRQAEMDLSQAYDYASEVMTRNMLARDAEEGIDAFLAKRQPQWTGT